MREFVLSSQQSPYTDPIIRIAFDPAGGKVVTQSLSFNHRDYHHLNTFSQLEIGSGVVRAMDQEDKGHHAILSADGRFATRLFPGPVVLRLWLPWSGQNERIFRLADSRSVVAWLTFAPNGLLYAGVNRMATGGRPTHADLLRIEPEKAIQIFDSPESGKSLAWPEYTSSQTNPLVVDDALEVVGRIEKALESNAHPAFTPDGRTMAVWPKQGPALVLEASSARVTRELPWTGHDAARRQEYRVALAPTGDRIALVGSGLLLCPTIEGIGKAWKTRTSVGYVTDGAFHPDGKSLLTVARTGQVSWLAAETGKVLAVWDWGVKPLLCVALNAEGSLAAAGGAHGELVVWDFDA